MSIFDENRRLSRKRCEIGRWLLWNVNRKSWVSDRIVSFSITLSDPNLGFQGHCILPSRISQNQCMLVSKIIYSQRLKTTRSSADADEPARRVCRSVKVIKHSTIPYVRYSFLLCNSNLSLRRAVFTIFDFKKCCDLEMGSKVTQGH